MARGGYIFVPKTIKPAEDRAWQVEHTFCYALEARKELGKFVSPELIPAVEHVISNLAVDARFWAEEFSPDGKGPEKVGGRLESLLKEIKSFTDPQDVHTRNARSVLDRWGVLVRDAPASDLLDQLQQVTEAALAGVRGKEAGEDQRKEDGGGKQPIKTPHRQAALELAWVWEEQHKEGPRRTPDSQRAQWGGPFFRFAETAQEGFVPHQYQLSDRILREVTKGEGAIHLTFTAVNAPFIRE